MVKDYHHIGKKRIVSKFLLFPFKDKGKWHWMRRVLMVEILILTAPILPVPIPIIEWVNLRIATIDDLININ